MIPVNDWFLIPQKGDTRFGRFTFCHSSVEDIKLRNSSYRVFFFAASVVTVVVEVADLSLPTDEYLCVWCGV